MGIPIVDAGTLAYKGNASTIIPGVTNCYSCEPKSTNQKAYPVCTIRTRPEKPIHCVVWAKLLFETMFAGTSDNDMSDMVELLQVEPLEAMKMVFQKEI